MSLRVVALGDSFSCGEGVGLDIRPAQTWTALLCDALPGADLVNLSCAGARVRDVRRYQLPAALSVSPHLATIMVGLNDVIRSGLSAQQIAEDLQVMVAELSGLGATVLVARWHDPGAVLNVPAGLRRSLALRLAYVNDAVDAATIAIPRSSSSPRSTGEARQQIMTLDLGCIPELADPGAWAVDGIHPSPAGHRAIALSACRILAGSGLPGLRIPEVADLLPMPPGPDRALRTRWLLSRGLPWLAQHFARVAPAVLSMAAQAVRDQRHPNPHQAAAIAPAPAVDQVPGLTQLTGVDPALALASRSTAREMECPVGWVGPVYGAGAQPPPGCGVASVGQRPRAPEVTRSAG